MERSDNMWRPSGKNQRAEHHIARDDRTFLLLQTPCSKSRVYPGLHVEVERIGSTRFLCVPGQWTLMFGLLEIESVFLLANPFERLL